MLLLISRNCSTPFLLSYAKILWRIVHLLFRILPTQSIDDLFNRWSKLASKKYNALLLTAASALCCAIWITRNEVVFDKCRSKSFLRVFFRGTHWLRQWANYSDLREQLTQAGQHLEISALHFFGSNGSYWSFSQNFTLILLFLLFGYKWNYLQLVSLPTGRTL
jgi:hypothetical protein